MAVRLAAMGAGCSLVVVAACGENPTPVTGTSPSAAAPSTTAPMKITDPYSPKIDPAGFRPRSTTLISQ
jgi:hypothetical protein